MKAKKLTISNIGPFNSGKKVVLPFEQLGASKLVAIHGPNGAGKTTLIECLPGAAYRTTPSRGSIAGLANAKDSLVELEVELDADYKLQLQIDGAGKTRKQAGYIFKDGEALNDGKVKTYDAEIAKHFPSKEIFLSSAFAAQSGEGRFLDLPPAQRKTLFAQMLGIGRLEEMSKLASEKARNMEKEIAILEDRKTRLEGEAKDLEYKEMLSELQKEKAMLESKIEGLQKDLEKSQKEMEDWKEQGQILEKSYQEASQEHKEANMLFMQQANACNQIKHDIDDLQSKLERLQQRTEGINELRWAAEELPKVQQCKTELAQEIEDLKQQETSYHSKRATWIEKGQELKAKLQSFESTFNQEKTDLQNRIKTLQRELAQSESLAKELDKTPCGGEGVYAACPLIASAVKASTTVEKNKPIIEKLQDDFLALEEPQEVANLKIKLDELRQSGPKKPDLEALPALQDMLANTETRLQKAIKAERELAALEEVEAQIIAARETIKTKEAGKIEADKKLVELETEKISTFKKAETAQKAVVEHQGCAPLLVSTDRIEAEKARLQNLEIDIHSVQQNLDRAEKAAHELSVVTDDHRILVEDFEDWKHLNKALGKDGIQALEIDAAGPEVSDLTNELLHACYGSRFTVSLETTKLKADGKGTKEVFELRVIDTLRGTELPADQLSGGEQVLVSEALSLAIAIYNTRRSSIPMDDLWRDECSGALSVENATKYIEMLRKAIDLGGFHRCYFIAHQPQLWELADRKIYFSNGNVEIQGG